MPHESFDQVSYYGCSKCYLKIMTLKGVLPMRIAPSVSKTKVTMGKESTKDKATISCQENLKDFADKIT